MRARLVGIGVVLVLVVVLMLSGYARAHGTHEGGRHCHGRWPAASCGKGRGR